MNEKIRHESSKKGTSFWLDLDSKIIFQRIKLNMKRPLLNNNKSENEIKKIMFFTVFCTKQHQTNGFENTYNIQDEDVSREEGSKPPEVMNVSRMAASSP